MYVGGQLGVWIREWTQVNEWLMNKKLRDS